MKLEFAEMTGPEIFEYFRFFSDLKIVINFSGINFKFILLISENG